MSRIFTEKFESGTAGTICTTGNTTYNGKQTSVGGNQLDPTFIASPSRSGLAMRVASTAATGQFARMEEVFGSTVFTHYRRFYFQVGAITASNQYFWSAWMSTTTQVSTLRVTSAGKIGVGNGAVLAFTSATVLTAGTWVRVEIGLDSAAGKQHLRLFVGANIEGVVPDEEQLNIAMPTSGFDRVAEGLQSAALSTLTYDNVAGDSSGWVGPESPVTQVARPVSDITTTGWAGSSAVTPLAQLIGESTRDDATYIDSGVNPTSLTIEVKLTSVTDPGPGARTGYTFTFALGAPGSTTASAVVSLIQGTTVIASWTETLVPSLTAFTHTLTDPQCAAITDYTDLRIRAVVTAA